MCPGISAVQKSRMQSLRSMSRGLRGCLRSGAPHVEGPRDKLACPKGISSLATVSEFERTIVLMHMKRFATVAFFLIASWLLTLPAEEVVKHFAEESPLRGAIPYLLAPGVICLYSSTVQLLIVVLFGVMAVIIADIAKLIIRSAWAWLVILLFQGGLVLDVLRAYGGEWWTYFAMLVWDHAGTCTSRRGASATYFRRPMAVDRGDGERGRDHFASANRASRTAQDWHPSRRLTRRRSRRGPDSVRRPSRLFQRYLSGVTPSAPRTSNAGRRRAALP